MKDEFEEKQDEIVVEDEEERQTRLQSLIEENLIYDSVDKEIRKIEEDKINFIRT